MKKVGKLLLCILIPLIIGGVGGIATASGVKGWYQTLNKPSFNPPNYLFGPVWTVLYILMGISLYLVLQSPSSSRSKQAFSAFCVQLFLNFWWSFLFFKFHLLGAALVEIVLIWLSIIVMITTFYRNNKVAALLQIPYLLWVTFASVLNGAIYYLN